MKPTAEPLRLQLRTPFRTAHGTSSTRTNALVRLGRGVGEGALPPYYPHRLEDVQAYVGALDLDAWFGETPLALEDALDRLPPGPAPARAAADIALHDHWGQQLDRPLYQLWGLSPARAPRSALTLSIPDDLDAFRERLRAMREWPVLKLKLGSGDLERDAVCVRIAREETGAPLGVDANGGWSLDEAAALIPRLGGHDLLFIEQPIGAEDAAAWQDLRARLPTGMPPIIADERIQTARDIVDLAGAIDGINVKLTKAGGLRAARQQIACARALGLKVLVGCMIESSVAVTAAAQLAPLADFCDLDGHLGVTKDPFAGARLDRGTIFLPGGPGLGLTERETA